jgi:putative oxidoreductase
MDLGRVVIRGVLGPLFIGHGTQKLFGWFQGHGLDGTGGFFESLGLRPGRRHATAAGMAEATGGALLTLGALTPLASTLISGTMITAIRTAHAKNGPWVTNNGYEYPLVITAAMLAIAEAGPGRPSVDHAAFPHLKGTGWASAQLAAAGVGSALATSPRFNAPEEEPAVEHPRRFVREPEREPAAR